MVTEGEARDHVRWVSSPSVRQVPATSPLRGRIEDPSNAPNPLSYNEPIWFAPANKTGSQP